MQIDLEIYRRMAAYNSWMTGKVYRTAGELSDAARKEDRGAFFKSIHSTLNHILFADRAWMRRFTGTPYEIKGMGVDLFEDFDALKDAHLAICSDIEAFVENLSSDWLAATETWVNTRGETHSRPRWLLVMHMFNHQTHHRGQITTLFSQAGLDVGPTDLPYMSDLL